MEFFNVANFRLAILVFIRLKRITIGIGIYIDMDIGSDVTGNKNTNLQMWIRKDKIMVYTDKKW